MPRAAPYGTWSSPITAEAITAGSVTFSDVVVDPISSTVYHIEGRPSEAGRNVLVNTLMGHDVVDKGWNVRTGVHEYGGAAAIAYNGVIYFSHVKDGRIYRIEEGKGEPEAVTPENKPYRFANFAVHPIHHHFLISILEDHTIDEPSEIVNTICIVNTKSKSVHTLLSGADFYAHPKFSPDGTRLAWMQWHHPDMPWEGSLLHIADIVFDADSLAFSLKNDTHIAGERKRISAEYPSWASNDTLLYISDESGFRNPWKYELGTSLSSPLFPSPVLQDFAHPMWGLQESHYALLDDEARYALWVAIKDGRNIFYLVDLRGGSPPVALGPAGEKYAVINTLRALSRAQHSVAFLGRNPAEESAIIKLAVTDPTGLPVLDYTVLKSGGSLLPRKFPEGIIALPCPMTLAAPGRELVHVVFYPPTNPQYDGSNIEGELPPCAIYVHGGPTSLEKQGLNWEVQYFTSRGWAYLNVNYGGSSGHGRVYMDRLVGTWGVVDVEDCAFAASVLSTGPKALIDPKRVVIRGGSAGGYTVLRAAGMPKNGLGKGFQFAAGTSMYGVSDLKTLTEEIHKFESHYLFKLIGGRFEEVPELYKEKSPLYHLEDVGMPLLILQGDIDRVVPKNQAEALYEGIKARGGDVEFKLYNGEGHGWRREETIRDSMEREIIFYERVLKIKDTM